MNTLLQMITSLIGSSPVGFDIIIYCFALVLFLLLFSSLIYFFMSVLKLIFGG